MMSGKGRGKAPRVNVMQSRGLGASQVRRDAVAQQAAAAFVLTQLPEAELDVPAAVLQTGDVPAEGQVEAMVSPVTAREVVERLRAERLHQVPLPEIRDSLSQPRRWYDPASLRELTADIRTRGLLQPVVLRTLSASELDAAGSAGSAPRYELVFGHRRLRAFRDLVSDPDPAVAERFVALPAFVAKAEEMSALDARLLTSAENRQRDDLSPLELARDIVAVRDVLAAHDEPSADFDLARFYGMLPAQTTSEGQTRLAARKAPGIVSEYRRIGEVVTDELLVAAGITRPAPNGERAVDWEIAAALRKGELYSVAKLQSEAARVEALRRVAAQVSGLRVSRHRGARNADGVGGHRFSYDGLRDRGEFYMRLSKPVRPESYTVTDGRRYLGDVEPLVALLAEIAAEKRPAYRPETPNMPGTYVILTKAPGDLTAAERAEALRVLEALTSEVRAGARPGPLD